MTNKFYSIQEAADILRVSTKTLRRWDQRGRFVPTRTAGNQRRYTREQIQEFKSQNSKAKIKVETNTLEPVFAPSISRELKFFRGLPSALNNFLGKDEVKLVESSLITEKEVTPATENGSPDNPESPAIGTSAFKVWFAFGCIFFILGIAGLIFAVKFNVAGLAQGDSRFIQFLANLPKINVDFKSSFSQSFQGQTRDLSFVSQNNQAVLAAEIGRFRPHPECECPGLLLSERRDWNHHD
jgi:excisionase family DNA binding protein